MNVSAAPAIRPDVKIVMTIEDATQIEQWLGNNYPGPGLVYDLYRNLHDYLFPPF